MIINHIIQFWWCPIFEKKFKITTPAIISINPNTAGQSGVCLKAKNPTIIIGTIPNADQIAYATPKDI